MKPNDIQFSVESRIKKALLLIICMLAGNCIAVTPGQFYFPEINFEDLLKLPIRTDSALHLLNVSKSDTSFFNTYHVYDSSSSFFIANLENDHSEELLYCGFGESEGKFTAIWKKRHNHYFKFGSISDSIIGISNRKNKPVFIASYSSGCCGDIFSYADLFKILDDSLESIRTVSILFLTRPPAKAISYKRFKLDNPEYYLRATPEKNDKIDTSDYKDFSIKGNVLAILKKGLIATATASEIDSTGRTWWFVVMDKPDSTSYNVFCARYNSWANNIINQKNGICGWLSTKMLKFIDISK